MVGNFRQRQLDYSTFKQNWHEAKTQLKLALLFLLTEEVIKSQCQHLLLVLKILVQRQ